jgi:NADH-dependent peroxiredoxin subunit C
MTNENNTSTCDIDHNGCMEDIGVRIGHAVPGMKLAAYDTVTGKEREITLSSLRGKWVILFFYPADFTFVCPTELGDMADHYDDFVKEGAEVLACSTDSVYVHRAWATTSETIKKVRFPMIGDTSHEIAHMFGVLMDDGLSLRGSFVIDPLGILRIAHVHDTSIGRSAKELLRALRAAKFVHEHKGEVCPANWEPGSETISPSMDIVGTL